MNKSPLRFLDYDVSDMLCKQIRIVKEYEARKFHESNFQNCIDINRDNHYLISKIFNEYIKRCYDHWWNLKYERKLNKLIKHKILVYEEELNDYLELKKGVETYGYEY
jgi:hypothetical protein